jgi:hypothetical protein
MLNSHELFEFMSADLATQIVEDAFGSDKDTYKATIAAVAQTRKLRPVFLQRQPKNARNKTILETLSRPGMAQAADNLLRNWLIKNQTKMLKDFLDATGIEHEDGVVEDLPEEVSDEQVKQGIDSILEKHSKENVIVYLHAFNSMNDCTWKNLDSMLQSDERLQF